MPKPHSVTIDVGVSALWRKSVPRAKALAEKMAQAAIAYGLKKAPERKFKKIKPYELSVVLTNDAAVRRLNRAYRGKDKPTNVLSFPADAPPGATWLLGDVVIAHGVTTRESRLENKTLDAHLAHLVIHGVLHLLGYDHLQDKDAAVMERLESDIMARMGFADPYAIPAPVDKVLPRTKSKPAREGRRHE
jgi:probable rRNA maturation factor